MSIISSVGYPVELPEVVAMLAQMKDGLVPYVSDSFDFEDIERAFEAAFSPASGKILVNFKSV